MPRGEIMGMRFEPAWTSRIVPNTPDQIVSLISRAPSLAWPKLPICVPTLEFVAASPIIIYQFWAFIGPAFSPVSRRVVLFVVACCVFLFLFGVVFCYLIVLPRGLAWLFGFNSHYFTAQARATDYFSFVAWFLVAFGAVFEMPVVIIAAVRMGIVKTKFLRKNWRYAIVINAVIAMVATPSQDAFSFIAMFIPLEILYEISLLIARVLEKRKAVTASQPADDDTGPSTAPV